MHNWSHKKHIFFDLDDTLWDFQSNSERVLKELYLEFDLRHKLNSEVDVFLEEYKRVNLLFWSLYGKGKIDKTYLREQRFKETFKRFNYENESDNFLLTQHYLSRAPKGSTLKQGCLEILNYLRPKHTLHIITNGFREIQGIKIDSGGIRDFFQNIIISEEHGLYKPDERIFRLAEHLSGAEPAECVMIGDNFENDVQGAIKAGWAAIHLDNENSTDSSGASIRNLLDLKKFF
ncbi:MAG: YjjG family noncanonical pyrimidine nucleotidase [Bacteroidia bacterium]|nr:YjjG family noncanonical pyrimidine nucleotidase [Bacteroidia bacterium]